MVHANTILDCFICNEKVGPFARGAFYHAKHHGITQEELWLKSSNLTEKPKCICSPTCQKQTRFIGWSVGYRLYAKGHADFEQKSEKMRKYHASHMHWAKGKTKETSEILARSGQKVSQTLKNGFKNDTIKHWNRGQTKHTHPMLAKQSIRMLGRKLHFYEASDVLNMIRDRLGDRFKFDVDAKSISQRKNNREFFFDIICTRCDLKTTTSIYNIVRKIKHKCKQCDVHKKWTSVGEGELAKLLEQKHGEVKRFVFVNGWSIDIFVPSINTYVQFDGIYWHGLDRPIEEQRNLKIKKKYFRDIEQNEWFLSHGLKLIRITDVEWEEALDKEALLNKIGLG